MRALPRINQHAAAAGREGKVIPVASGRGRVSIARHSGDGFAMVRAWRVEHRDGRRHAVEADAAAILARPALDLGTASDGSTPDGPMDGSLSASHPVQGGPDAPGALPRGSSAAPAAAGRRAAPAFSLKRQANSVCRFDFGPPATLPQLP